MNKKTAILAMAMIALITIPSVAASTTRVFKTPDHDYGAYIDFTPGVEIIGGLKPDMIVSYGLPPYDTFFHVGSVNTATGIVTVREGSITTVNGSILRNVPLSNVYFVSSPFYRYSNPEMPISIPT